MFLFFVQSSLSWYSNCFSFRFQKRISYLSRGVRLSARCEILPQVAKIFSLPLNILPSYFLFGLLLPPDPPLLLLLFALPVSVLLCQGVAALLLRARLPSLLLPLIILNFLLPDLTLPPSPAPLHQTSIFSFKRGTLWVFTWGQFIWPYISINSCPSIWNCLKQV